MNPTQVVCKPCFTQGPSWACSLLNILDSTRMLRDIYFICEYICRYRKTVGPIYRSIQSYIFYKLHLKITQCARMSMKYMQHQFQTRVWSLDYAPANAWFPQRLRQSMQWRKYTCISSRKRHRCRRKRYIKATPPYQTMFVSYTPHPLPPSPKARWQWPEIKAPLGYLV